MPSVTIQLLDGLERGRVFSDMTPPVSIGREEDNDIRLNDERVSRFHAKLQTEGEKVILTDLDSTNGTRVNGHPIQLHILNIGDQILIGRCLMIFGSRQEVEEHAKKLLDVHSGSEDFTVAGQPPSSDPLAPIANLEQTNQHEQQNSEELWSLPKLFPHGAPKIPSSLGASQRAEMADLLAYMHDRIRVVLETATHGTGDEKQDHPAMQVNWITWQSLLSLEMDLANWLRKVAEPDE